MTSGGSPSAAATPMATRLIADTARELGKKAVHIKVSPRPSLYDSRQILKFLHNYGDVVMFRNMKYEPLAPATNTILAVFRTPESASRLIESSPLEVTFREQRDIGTHEHNVHNGNNGASTEHDESPSSEANARHFTLKVDVSLLDHHAYIKRQHYYGAFAIDSTSPISEDLKNSVPYEGLSVISMKAPERHLALLRIEQKELSSRKTLYKLWEEGMKSSGAVQPLAQK